MNKEKLLKLKKTLSNLYLTGLSGFIPYHSEYARITRSAHGALILSYILHVYRYVSTDGCGSFRDNPLKFYQFKQPRDHEEYKEGKSWCEELGITPKEFDIALKLMGFKNGVKNKLPKEKAIIWYTHVEDDYALYEINVEFLAKKLQDINQHKYLYF